MIGVNRRYGIWIEYLSRSVLRVHCQLMWKRHVFQRRDEAQLLHLGYATDYSDVGVCLGLFIRYKTVYF